MTQQQTPNLWVKVTFWGMITGVALGASMLGGILFKVDRIGTDLKELTTEVHQLNIDHERRITKLEVKP